MNILFLADNFPPEKNAQASRVYERACYWVNWGHRVTVITCAPNFPEGKVYEGYRNRWYHVSEMSGIRVVRVKTFLAPNAGTVLRILDFLSYMASAFVAGLFQDRPDVVAATSPQFFAAVAGMVLARVWRLPFVMEVSDLWPDSIAVLGAMKPGLSLRLLERVELAMYRAAARVVVLTPAFQSNLVRRGVPPDKIDVVINGVDLARYAPRPRDAELARAWGIAPAEFVIGYIGTHGMAHALENVLNAAAVCGGRVRWLLVGAGAERTRLVAEKERRGLANVSMIPSQPKERMPDVWSLCDVALVHLRNVPLFRTVIPSKIFEAMGMGLPVLLAAPQGEASGIVESEGAGVWVPAEDPAALAQAAGFLASEPDIVRHYAARSRRAAPRYSREKQARDMLAALERAAGKQAKAAAAAAR